MVQVDTSQVSKSLLDFVTQTENTLRSQSLNGNLPILGDGLQKQVDSILNPVTVFRQDIEASLNGDRSIESQVLADQLSEILGVDVEIVSEQGEDVEFSLEYSGETNLDFAVESNLGLDGLDFDSFSANVAADVNYTFPEVRFGLENGNAFARSTDNQLNLEFDLQPFSSFSGEIGLLDVDLTPISDLDFNLTVDLETSSSAIDFGEDNLTLFEFDLSSGSQLPSISGKIDFDTTAIETAYDIAGQSLPFTIADLAIDANSFVNDFLTTKFIAPVQNTIAPIIDELMFLQEPIELLNNVSNEGIKNGLIEFLDRGEPGDGIITLLDLIGLAAETQGINLDTTLIERGISLVSDISSIKVNANAINLGNIDFRPENIIGEDLEEAIATSLTDDSLITDMPDNLDNFKIPILETPGDAVLDLLLGRGIELVNYTLPEFQFRGTIGETFPVYPPIGVFVGGAFDLATNLEFGIDTFGLRQGNLEDGFFFVNNDKPEVTTNIGPAVGIGLQFGAGSVQVYQGFTGGTNLNLKDPDGDRKIRLDEIDLNDPFSIFESEPNLGLTLGGSIRLLGATLFSQEAGTSFSPEELKAEVDDIWADVQTVLDTLKDLSPQEVANNIGDLIKDIGDIVPELNPLKENSALYEGLSNLDITNPNSIVRQGIDKIGGESVKAAFKEFDEAFTSLGEEAKALKDQLTLKNFQEKGSQLIEDAKSKANEIENLAQETREKGADVYDRAVEDVEALCSNEFCQKLGESNPIKKLPGLGLTDNDILFSDLNKATSDIEQLSSDMGLNLAGFDRISNLGNAVVEALEKTKDNFTRVFIDHLTTNLLLEGAELESNELYSGDGNDTLRGGILSDNLLSGGGDDLLEGESEADYLNGGTGNDSLIGGFGNDTLIGGAGEDTLIGGVGNNSLFGDDGNDVLLANLDGENELFGGRGNDILHAGRKSDTLYGGDGDDTLTTASDFVANDSLLGGAGNDFIFAGAGDDTLIGGQGNDTLRGDKNNDRLDGGQGDDSLAGEAGNDFLVGNAGSDTIQGGDGIDTVSYELSSNDSNTGISIALDGGTPGFDGIDGFDLVQNVENVVGSQYRDSIIGNNVANLIRGEAGDDNLRGMAGNDTIDGGLGADTIEGGAGNDTIEGGAGNDTVSYQSLENDSRMGASIILDNSGVLSISSDGFDLIQNVENAVGSQYGDSILGSNVANLIRGEAGDDNLRGMAGNDTFFGGGGADTIDGGDGIDTAFYNFSLEGVSIDLLTDIYSGGEAEGDRLQGIEVVVGSNQNDTLIGDDSNNVLSGFGGQDSLVGNGGNDELIGGDGDDLLEGGAGNDTIDGGMGNDTVSYQSLENDSRTGVVIALDSLIPNSDGSGIDTIQNIENVNASQYEDRIIGNSIANVIRGEAGNDTLEGDLGNDLIYGDDGDDRLYGDLNNEIMFGTEIENDFGLEENSPIVSVAANISDDTLFGGAGADYLDGGNGSDELYGEAGNDTLISKNGSDLLQGGIGNDVYQLSASNHSGVVIEDLEGNDTLTIENTELVLAQPGDDIIGLARNETNLIIDLNRDGMIDTQSDLTIINFFDESDIEAGDGFIENLSNLSGIDVLDFF